MSYNIFYLTSKILLSVRWRSSLGKFSKDVLVIFRNVSLSLCHALGGSKRWTAQKLDTMFWKVRKGRRSSNTLPFFQFVTSEFPESWSKKFPRIILAVNYLYAFPHLLLHSVSQLPVGHHQLPAMCWGTTARIHQKGGEMELTKQHSGICARMDCHRQITNSIFSHFWKALYFCWHNSLTSIFTCHY